MKISRKASQFNESVIREMTRHAMVHGAVNLAQGFPDFPCPQVIKDAAAKAVLDDVNQYAITWGAKSFREALVEKHERCTGLAFDPETEVTVTCGSTEAMIATLLALVDPGDEVVVFEPFYENYGPDSVLCGATPRFVPLEPHAGGWSFDPARLRAAFNEKTRAIIVNTPNNPTGKVFDCEELQAIADLCIEFDAVAITDEIYEHILFDGAQHICLASLDGMRERTVTVNGLSKTYSVTGWRIGYALAVPELTGAIRKVHDFLTVGAAAPLQEAGAAALRMEEEYYAGLSKLYEAKRDRFLPVLERAGFKCFKPAGAYYVMTDIGGFGFSDDVEFTLDLIREGGVSVVPGSSFFSQPGAGGNLVRFCFCKREETLDEAAERLLRWAKKG